MQSEPGEAFVKCEGCDEGLFGRTKKTCKKLPKAGVIELGRLSFMHYKYI